MRYFQLEARSFQLLFPFNVHRDGNSQERAASRGARKAAQRNAADLLALNLGRPRFTWGRANLIKPADARRRYIAALRAADNHDIEPLIEFARS